MFQNTQQNIPICVALNAVSGFLQAIATMILAYPEYLEKKKGQQFVGGTEKRTWFKRFCVLSYIIFYILGMLINVAGAAFGPVSIAVPIEYGSRILFNAIAMCLVLRIKFLDKSQASGTIILVLSIFILIDVGPNIQEEQLASYLLSQPASLVWIAILIFAQIVSVVIFFFLPRKEITLNQNPTNENDILGSEKDNLEKPVIEKYLKVTPFSFSILQIGTVSSAVIYNSLAKFVSLSDNSSLQLGGYFVFMFFSFVVNAGFAGVSAKGFDQSLFIPFYSVASLLLNMITGIIVWEEWKAIDTWMSYMCTFTNMLLGVYLVSEVDLVQRYQRRKQSQMALESIPVLRKSAVILGSLKQGDISTQNNAKKNVNDEEKGLSTNIQDNRIGNKAINQSITWSLVLTSGDKKLEKAISHRRSLALSLLLTPSDEVPLHLPQNSTMQR